jgi:hypothetical protein
LRWRAGRSGCSSSRPRRHAGQLLVFADVGREIARGRSLPQGRQAKQAPVVNVSIAKLKAANRITLLRSKAGLPKPVHDRGMAIYQALSARIAIGKLQLPQLFEPQRQRLRSVHRAKALRRTGAGSRYVACSSPRALRLAPGAARARRGPWADNSQTCLVA